MLLIVASAFLVLYVLWQLQPDRMERKGPNAWVGMRSPATVSSPAAWAAAHKAAWPMARAGCCVALLLLAAAAVVVALASDEHQWEVGALGMGAATTALLVFLVVAFRGADRAALAVSERSGERDRPEEW